MTSIYSYDVFGITDVGTVKKVNEDSFVYKVADINSNIAGLFVVADGVGGLSDGQKASRICVSKINQWWENEIKNYANMAARIDIEGLRNAIIDSNKRIKIDSERNEKRSGTTLTMLVTLNDKAVLAHVGDSRCYRYHKSISWNLDQISSDHSCEVVKERNGIKELKTVLTDCIGYRESFRLDIMEFVMNNGDHYMLCSDGIYKTQSDHEIERAFKQNKGRLEDLCKTLVEGAKRNNETDNISIIVFSVENVKV